MEKLDYCLYCSNKDLNYFIYRFGIYYCKICDSNFTEEVITINRNNISNAQRDIIFLYNNKISLASNKANLAMYVDFDISNYNCSLHKEYVDVYKKLIQNLIFE